MTDIDIPPSCEIIRFCQGGHCDIQSPVLHARLHSCEGGSPRLIGGSPPVKAPSCLPQLIQQAVRFHLESVTCQEEGKGEITSPSGNEEYPVGVRSERQRQRDDISETI